MGRLLISIIIVIGTFGISHARNSDDVDASIQAAMDAALSAVMTAQLDAPEASRIYAMMAVSIHDSYDIAQGRRGYMSDEIGQTNAGDLITASTQAVLLSAFPDQNFTLPVNNEATALGQAIAADITKHFIKPSPVSFEDKGLWVIGDKIPLIPEWVDAPLLEMEHPSQFRLVGPPNIASTEFTKALEEVRRLGEDLSEVRLADHSMSARFWMDAPETFTPPGHWNYIALETLDNLPTATKVDMLLALNTALYDAGIAAWDTKYHYRFWRPDAAIAARYPKEDWRPMAETPLHPEYVSGHSTFSGAAAKVLTHYAGEKPFCTVSKELWDLERCFPSYQAAAEEAGMSRIYGGIHYSFSNKDGLTLGADVAEYILKRLQEKGVVKMP